MRWGFDRMTNWSNHHGLLDRMFLRDAAFLMRIGGHGDGLWLWHFAALATSMTLASVALLVLAILVALFQADIPPGLNPPTATRDVVVIECLVLFLGIGAWVDRKVARFKNNMAAARRYMSGVDLLWWCVATLATFAGPIGTAVVIYSMRSSTGG